MDKNNLCIATITWARNDEEELLLKKSLQQLAALNMPVFVADGGSGNAFLNFIKSLPQFTVLHTTKKGVQAQAVNSVPAAFKSGIPFIFYTEPDKEEFFSKWLLPFIEQAVADEKTGVVMASRNAHAFASFPLFQQMTETTINNCCTKIILKNLDYTYGPFIVNRKLIPYVNNLKEDIGWGWRPYTFILAKRLGYTVDAIEGSFHCPLSQQEDDEKESLYRMKQLEQNIRGIVLAAVVGL